MVTKIIGHLRNSFRISSEIDIDVRFSLFAIRVFLPSGRYGGPLPAAGTKPAGGALHMRLARAYGSVANESRVTNTATSGRYLTMRPAVPAGSSPLLDRGFEQQRQP